jgi:GT2 family glycosyltransferase/glycosyltransferase involved in cell wall biosynthesis
LTADKPFRVSAIVSVYNADTFIHGCLADLTQQSLFTSGELEIIIVDSASPGNERQLISDFLHQPSGTQQIKYIRTEQRETLYGAWNRGIHMAGGQYLTNANCDDRHAPKAFEIMAKMLDAHPDVSLVYADARESVVENESFESCTSKNIYAYPEFSFAGCLLHFQFGHQPMWRASLHDEIGDFDPELRAVGDYDFNFRFNLHGKKAMHIPEILGVFYQNPASLTNASSRQAEEKRLVQGRYRNEANILKLARRDGVQFQSARDKAGYLLKLGTNALQFKTPWSQTLRSDLEFSSACFQFAERFIPGSAEVEYNLNELLQIAKGIKSVSQTKFITEVSGFPPEKPALNRDGDRLRIACFAGDEDNFGFFRPIRKYLESKNYAISLHKTKGMDEAGLRTIIRNTDLLWHEWANGPLIKISSIDKLCPLIVRLHRYEAYEYPISLINWFGIDKLITINPAFTEVIKKYRDHNFDKNVAVTPIPNPVASALTLRKGPRNKRIAYVSRFQKDKNPALMIQILKKLVEQDPGFTLSMVGKIQDQQLYDYCMELIQRLGLQDHFSYEGVSENVSAWLEDKSYFLSTSIVESQGLGIMEAMMRGLKPVIHNGFGNLDALYRQEYLFNTIEEAVASFLAPAYHPLQYREDVITKFADTQILPRIERLILDAIAQYDPENPLLPGYYARLAESHSASGIDKEQSTEQPKHRATPLISVCIPSYNRADLIGEAIHSVLQQNFQDFEIIIVDDGSTDNTEAVVEHFTDPRIFYYKKAHSGAPETRNLAVQKARGTYIAWLDSDDILLPNALSVLYQCMVETPELDVSYANLIATDATLQPLRELPYQDWYGKKDELISRMLFQNPIPNCGSLIRRDAFAKVGAYNTSFRRAHDYEWWSRAAAVLSFRHVNSFVYLWRWHETNMSSGTVKIDTSFERRIIEGLIEKHGLQKLLPQLPWDQKPMIAATQAKVLLAQKFAELRQMDVAIEYVRSAYQNSKVPELQDLLKQYQHISFSETKKVPFRILFVAHNFANHNAAGTENYLLDFAKALQKINIHAEIFYPFIIPGKQPEIISGTYEGVPFFELQYSGPEFFSHYVSHPEIEEIFRAHIRNRSYDIIHFHHWLNLPNELLRVAKAEGFPVVATFHDSYLLCQRIHLLYTGKGKVICTGPETAEKCAQCVGCSESYFRQRFASVKACLEEVDLITTPSAFMSGLFRSNRFCDRVEVLPLGLNPVEHVAKQAHDGIVYGYIGSIQPLKNVDFLVSVFKKRPKEKLIIYGNGPDAAIAELVGSLTNCPNIFYKGAYQPKELAQILSEFDVLIVPSLVENYPLTIREAFSAGTAVIGANRGGIPEIITDKVNGLLFDPLDESSLESIISSIASDPNILTELSSHIPKIKSMAEDAAVWEEKYLEVKGFHRKPLVSIIIPVFNNIEYTKQCLDSLYRFTEEGLFEVIIIDNASTDRTEAEILGRTEHVQNLRYVRNAENTGFARANNQGARLAEGKYLLLLNNDTEFIQPWLKPLLAVLQNDSTVAGAGPKLLYADRTIQHAGVVLIEDQSKSPARLVGHHLYAGLPENEPDTVYSRVCSSLTAACLLLRKEEFLSVNGFDEAYWNGYEDVDLCLRLRERGKVLVFEPNSTLIHHESKSGPERFSRAAENTELLNSRWYGKVPVDFIKQPDGKLVPAAHEIQPYKKGRPSLTSIVIPVFNNLEYTRQCIDSLLVSTKLPIEVVIVNNASTDGTRDYLQSLRAGSDKFVVIENKVNVGFPGAVNQGLKAATGEYIVIANNDLIFTDQWLERMLSLLLSQPNYGITAPMSNFVSGVQIDKEARYTTIEEMFSYAGKRAVAERGKYFEFPRVAFLCVLFKKELLEKIGGLDERFAPGNFEDDDYCLRLQLAGYTCAIAQDVFIHHFGSKSFLADGEKKYQERLQKNRLLFVNKWGYDPDEIWLQGKAPRQRNLLIPLLQNRYTELATRMQSLIAENDYEAAKIETEKVLALISEPGFVISETERSHFQRLHEKLCQITANSVPESVA